MCRMMALSTASAPLPSKLPTAAAAAAAAEAFEAHQGRMVALAATTTGAVPCPRFKSSPPLHLAPLPFHRSPELPAFETPSKCSSGHETSSAPKNFHIILKWIMQFVIEQIG